MKFNNRQAGRQLLGIEITKIKFMFYTAFIIPHLEYRVQAWKLYVNKGVRRLKENEYNKCMSCAKKEDW